jgi:large subunit ribosomal protein L7/L12
MMAKVTKDDILESLDSMTVLELSELVEALKEKYNVSGAPMAVAAMPSDNGAAPAEVEQTEFSVEITSAGQSKIKVIKAVREITGLGLRDAKAVVDKAPETIKEGLTREEADAMVTQLEEVGATVEVK